MEEGKEGRKGREGKRQRKEQGRHHPNKMLVTGL